MQDCLLHGHVPVRMAGSGPFEGRSFIVCSECSATWPEGSEPPHIRQQLAGEDAFLEGMAQRVSSTQIYGTDREPIEYQKFAPFMPLIPAAAAAREAGRCARLDNLPRNVPTEYADHALEWHEGWEDAFSDELST